VYKNNKAIDPLRMDSPPALPVNAKYKASYDSIREMYESNMKLVK
jgi:hypothetical protein